MSSRFNGATSPARAWSRWPRSAPGCAASRRTEAERRCATSASFGVELRLSIATSMQYRWNFLVDGFVSLIWTTLGLVPLFIAFGARPSMGGWTIYEALVVVAWFTLLKGLLDGAVNPSLLQVVDQIRARARSTSSLTEARRRSVPRLDRALRAVEGTRRGRGARALRLRVPRPSVASPELASGALLALVMLASARRDGPLLSVDPRGRRGLLGRAPRQPCLPLQLALRPRALAGLDLQGRLARRLHLRRAARDPHHLSGPGPPGDARRSSTAALSVAGVDRLSRSLARAVWKRALGRYTSASS